MTTPTNRGRLTVLVAAAPGAGKTYAMLEEGHRLKAKGKDVVVGIAETYHRPKTEALLEGLDVTPRRIVHYKNVVLEEMDLEEILARRPEIVLVDEMYHTNAPGVTHEKRWEDVEDIRDAGIDVITTMNIGHLESLKDVAEQIAGLKIRETIPDHMLEDADEVQLVDISPEALRKRMKHGNIYPEKNIERALDGFFRPGNLAALRELALNWLANTEADRIAEEDKQVARENVVAAVREPLQSQSLIRRAIRISRRYRGECTIVTVLRTGEPLPDELEQAQVLAEALEAGFEVLTATDPGEAIVEAVRRHHASQLLIGAPGGRFMERYRGSLVDRLLDELTDVDLHIIARFEAIADSEVDAKAIVESSTEAPAADPIGTEGGERGYLRIYIGYAPGTGTTVTMLHEAQRRAGRGTKVVVGAAATYGLPANEEALQGLTVMPPRIPPTRPGGSADMDLDAVMASGADVVAVDDLGYENRAPDAKYRYRFEEVEALRRAGFKLIATVHLRDVASVADIVSAATGIDAQSKVPDWVLRQSTELELVDVPPATLLERLEHHEVPVSSERREELRRIFTLDVLGRLREIALRLVASHTDDRLLAYMEARGITSPWESMVRVMAAVAPQPGLERLIERAAAGARRAEGKLVVVSVDSGGDRDPEGAQALAAYQDLTLKLGGQFVTLKSSKPGQALLEYAKKTHVTEIVLARGDHKEKSGPLGSSIKREIIRGASQIDVHVLRALDTQAVAGTAPERHTAHVARLASEASNKEASEKLAAEAAAIKREDEVEQEES